MNPYTPPATEQAAAKSTFWTPKVQLIAALSGWAVVAFEGACWLIVQIVM